jgi:hypothetical protein
LDLVEAPFGALACLVGVVADGVGVGGGNDGEVEGGRLAGGVWGGVCAWGVEPSDGGEEREGVIDGFSAVGERRVAAALGGESFGACLVHVAERCFERFGCLAAEPGDGVALPGGIGGVAGGQLDTAADAAKGGVVACFEVDPVDDRAVLVGVEADRHPPAFVEVAGHPVDGVVDRALVYRAVGEVVVTRKPFR